MQKKYLRPDLPLLPDFLKDAWAQVEKGIKTREEFLAEENDAFSPYRRAWADSLLLPGNTNLPESICRELQAILQPGESRENIEARCRVAMKKMKEEWENLVSAEDGNSVIEYYDRSENYPYELMWWHSLADDQSPLAYVCALHLALRNEGRSYLDFGSGVGSGGLLFAAHDFDVTLADISSALLNFAEKRLQLHNVSASFFDLKTESLPPDSFDMITAMDVFEHIANPEETVRSLVPLLRSGGILFGRFHADIDPDRPSHIARDFGPTFALLEELGFRECWKDEWLWGHQAFQKP
jgi:mycofactocin glycosyltransferase